MTRRFRSIHVPARRRHPGTLLLLATTAALALVPDMALAQLTDKPVRMVNDVAQLLQLMGIGLFTCAVLWASYKMIFEGARFGSISNIFWGGVLAGAAGIIAGWAMAA
jgi:type IV secretion system protein VirB2